jgi:hypothetical protein
MHVHFMQKITKNIDYLEIFIACVSLFLAIPITLVFGSLVFGGAFLLVIPAIMMPSLQTFLPFSLAAGGSLGILGLWLRVFLQPFSRQSIRTIFIVAVFLLAGATSMLYFFISQIRSLSFKLDRKLAFIDFYAEAIFLLIPSVLAFTIALHNLYLCWARKQKISI